MKCVQSELAGKGKRERVRRGGVVVVRKQCILSENAKIG